MIFLKSIKSKNKHYANPTALNSHPDRAKALQKHCRENTIHHLFGKPATVKEWWQVQNLYKESSLYKLILKCKGQ